MSQDTNKRTQFTSLLWTFMGNFSSQVVGFIVSIFLARLLEPEEFGIVGMSLVFISLLQLFVDSGFSTALIQLKKESNVLYDTVFSFNFGVSLVLFVILWFSAPGIAVFYGEPIISPLVKALAFIMPINALAIVHRVILERHLRFKELGIRLFGAGLISGIIGIFLAYNGFGVYALAGQILSASILNAILLWYASSWRPQLPRHLGGLKELSQYSGYVFLGTLLNRAINEGNALVIGRLFSPATLGFYTRADSLNLLVTKYASATVAKVYLPILSKLQDSEERFRELFVRVISNTTALTLLLAGILILIAEVLIIGMFGAKWTQSVLIFQVIMLKIYAFPVNSIIVNAYLALGMAKRNFTLGLFRAFIRLSPFVVAYYGGFNAFLHALVATSALGTLFNLYWVSRDLRIPLSRQFKMLGKWTLLFIGSIIPPLWLYSTLVGVEEYTLLQKILADIPCVFLFISLYFSGAIWLEPELKSFTRSGINRIKHLCKN